MGRYCLLLSRCGLCASLLWLFSLPLAAADCERSLRGVDVRPVINGWSPGLGNERYTPGALAGLQADTLSALTPQWVYALPDTDAPRSQPAVTADTVFIADGDGGVYALDRRTGCGKWRFDAGSMVRTALRLVETGDETLLTFGTLDAELLALRPTDGSLVWRTRVSPHARAMISGSAAFHAGVLYQGISSWEVFWAANPFYACCTFRGGVVAVEADSGAIRWRAYTIEQEPTVTRARWLLPDHLGPSGAPVWSHPAIDVQRGLLYVGTGENYSSPATDTSDAIIAFRLDTGEQVWSRQFLAEDAWNVACVVPGHPNCPRERGGDLDFGAPPILTRVAGRDYILAGQKSGRVFALDPDADGALLWSVRAGSGGKAGGVHFGMAVDPQRGLLFVPISDRDVGTLLGDSGEGAPRPSLHALDITSGETRWVVDAPGDCREPAASGGKPVKGCYPGFSAPASVAGDIVFAPTLDGVLRAFDSESGRSLWEYDTRRRFDAVNGSARGGAIDLGGVYAAQGQLFLSSGYGLVNQIPGNAFIVFGAESAAR